MVRFHISREQVIFTVPHMGSMSWKVSEMNEEDLPQQLSVSPEYSRQVRKMLFIWTSHIDDHSAKQMVLSQE